MSVSSENSMINIDPYNNNNYGLIYVTSNGVINIVNKDVWLNQYKYNATGSNVTDLKTLLKISKITQTNTGDFVYLGNDCNVYRVPNTFTNPVFISDKKFTGITQLSNYKLLLTSKEGKMYTVDDINNFDQTIKQYFDDGTNYCSVKQTFDGYVVAIDGTQCGNAWRFDLKKNQLLNKTKLNLDEGITNRVTLFLPSQKALINLNCDSRYKDRLIKYDFSDKTIKTTYDLRCDDNEEYESINGGSCYKKCPDGYSSIKDDYTSCWQKCGDGYTLKGGVCYLDQATTYDRGVGIAPDYDYSACNDLQSVVKGIGSCTGTVPKVCKTCNDICGDLKSVTCVPNSTCTGTKPKTCRTCKDACHGLKSITCGSDTCSGWDGAVLKTRSLNCTGGNVVTRDLDCTGGNVVTRNASASCKSNREMQAGLCYEKCRDGYTGNATICSYHNGKDWSFVPKTTPRIYDGKSGYPSPITCDSDCCMFDLTFFNPLYTKPSDLPVLPDLPVTLGLVGYYDASSFILNNGIWYDLSPKSNNAVYVKGDFINNGTYISGTTTSSILFPTQILPAEYTVFNIGKYSGANKGKILCGYYNNWFSGFNAGLSGIAGRDKPITQTTLSAFDDNWVFSTDINTTYRANGNNYTVQTTTSSDTSAQLSINLNDDSKSNSDFAIGCVIVFNRILSDNEILSMESWLTSKYSDLWAGTYKKTFAQEGYTCFNGSVGKVTNNYLNYTYASYKNGTLGCEWLNLPEKKNLNPLTCTSIESESYETFNNFYIKDSDSFIPDYIFYPLIIVLLIIIIYKRCNKDK